MAGIVEDHLVSQAVAQGRAGGYLRAFRIAYSDGAQMVTVGGFLPGTNNVVAARSAIEARAWAGRPALPIVTPPLTAQEIEALQRRLPLKRPLTRMDVQALGFDLEDAQIELFQTHY